MKKHTSIRGGFTLVQIMITIAVLALLAAFAIPQLHAGQMQVIDKSTPTTNVNFIIANTTVNYNPPGIAINSPLYNAAWSNAPVFNCVGADRVALQGTLNETATNTTTETFTLLCSLDGANWMTPPPPLPPSFNVSTLNTNFSSTNLVFGTNFATGAWPLWCIGSITHSGATGTLTNLNLRAFTKAGGL